MKGYMKGNILDQGVNIVLGIVIIGFLLGAGAIGLSSFATGQTSYALAAINNSSIGLQNFGLQMPNIGTIGGIAILLIVLLGAFVMFMPRR